MTKDTLKKRAYISKKAAVAKAGVAVERLKQLYPAAICALEWCGEGYRTTTHESPTYAEGYLPSPTLLKESWKLLVMGRLSAQCTDARVNLVCRELFEKFPTVESMAEGDILDIEAIVRPCGLYHTKAQNIKDACAILVEKHGGIVPCDMDALLALPGVGRKIANLLLGDVYRVPSVVADTHCIRICGRLGFYPEDVKDPTKVENIMSGFIEPREQSDFCHRIVQFGRDVCMARSPACEGCPLRDICKHAEKSKK
ncbi:MAG: endonuclease III [Ruminococcaceae bacterium]|nr:endonuclease III [Oscillospiraceae bacterium]